MMKVFFIISTVLLAVASLPAHLPDPSNFALVLNEDEFEDYLDTWLAIEEPKWRNASSEVRNGGCTIKVNGHLGQPQPVYLHNGDYPVPTGTTAEIHLKTGEEVYVACTGSGRTISHPNIAATTATGWAKCVSDSQVTGSGWLNGVGDFGELTCSSHAYHDAEYTGETCYNNNKVIRVGFIVDGTFYPKYFSCYDPNRFEVLYVWYDQNPPNAVHQTGVDRPSWLAGSFFPGVGINNLYTQVQQKIAIAALVGDELADKYVTSHQFLSRGHLAAKTDFIYATGQRSSFYFINAAPQWQPFNAGNWNTLEQLARARIGAAGYYTTVYTGTFGVSQLRNQNGQLVDIYLHKDANNNDQLPIPLYYYKVIYDASKQLGTAFVSINNPYYTEEEVKQLTFCTDRCRNNDDFKWLNWEPDRIDIGYSFCCDVDEFRKTVPHLTNFTVKGLLA